MGWIGFDLDGTLAEWGEGTSNPGDVMIIGAAIPAMINRLKEHLAAGDEVRIFTARVGPATEEECQLQGQESIDHFIAYQKALIEQWCREHLWQVLPITATKDFHLLILYDDRCKQVVTNQGILVEQVLVNVVDRLKEIKAIVGEEETPV